MYNDTVFVDRGESLLLATTACLEAFVRVFSVEAWNSSAPDSRPHRGEVMITASW
jgi:hypothetical protein